MSFTQLTHFCGNGPLAKVRRAFYINRTVRLPAPSCLTVDDRA